MALSKALIAASQVATKTLAGRETPFLANCWYVAAFGSELCQERLISRTILGKPLVFYRTDAGAPCALDDRCPHRSFPLSKGKLEHGILVCGYHGLRYASNGQCIAIPGQKAAPQGIAVRSYPMLEAGPLVWIWMGSKEPTALPVETGWISEGRTWPSSRGYFHLPAHYISLHENLLDLTHLSFLHSGTFGTPDYALAPYTVEIDEEKGQFSIHRAVSPTTLPPVWAKPTGLENRRAARIANSRFVSPAIHMVNVRFYDCDQLEGTRAQFQIATAHLVTPETAHSTHYFIHHGRDFAIQDSEVTRFMHEQLFAAFREDVDGLTAVEIAIRATPPCDYHEISIASDRAGVAMRRWLLRQVQGAPN